MVEEGSSMEEFEYIPKGVCSRKLMFKIENNNIVDFDVIGGCPGNLQGIRKLIKGMNIDEVIEKLEGTKDKPEFVGKNGVL